MAIRRVWVFMALRSLQELYNISVSSVCWVLYCILVSGVIELWMELWIGRLLLSWVGVLGFGPMMAVKWAGPLTEA